MVKHTTPYYTGTSAESWGSRASTFLLTHSFFLVPPPLEMLRAALLALASSSLSPLALASRRGPHAAWVDVGLDTATRVEFAVAVRERNQAAVRRLALAVSDPSSDTYGQHLTAAELKVLTAPTRADVTAARSWIRSESGCAIDAVRTGMLWVSCTTAAAGRLLATTFRRLVNLNTRQQAVLAATHTVPDRTRAAVAAIFGLDSLPLPPARRRQTLPPQQQQQAVMNVTPAEIAEAYGVRGVSVDRSSSSRNSQAVAEFQGATANVSDLTAFFAQYVPGAQPGDATVHAFVGDAGAGSAEAEASLDIQYLMGVAPGIKTSFYMYSDLDLCTGLKLWASQLLEDPSPPLVHSISYGESSCDRHVSPLMQIPSFLMHCFPSNSHTRFAGSGAGIQTNLSSAPGTPAGPDYGCTTASIRAVDDDLAKLAARGLSIIVASGDEGSGYNLDDYCSGVSDGSPCMRTGIQLTGTELPQPPGQQAIRNAADCCALSFNSNATAFTFKEAANPTPEPRCAAGGGAGEVIVGEPHWGVPARQFIGLTHTEVECCAAAEEHGVGYTFLTGTSSFYPQIEGSFPCLASGSGCCIVFDSITHKVSNAPNCSSGANPLKAPGKCQLFVRVDGESTVAGAGTTSGGTLFAGRPRLFPSWPASSPWVTAVGATRFPDASLHRHTPATRSSSSGSGSGGGGSSEQVASRQFGSGGGFSAFFPRDPVAAFQATAVESYLNGETAAGAHWPLPSATTINALSGGRATPDVAALGEGFVVVQNGVATLLSGTSASTPVFAGCGNAFFAPFTVWKTTT